MSTFPDRFARCCNSSSRHRDLFKPHRHSHKSHWKCQLTNPLKIALHNLRSIRLTSLVKTTSCNRCFGLTFNLNLLANHGQIENRWRNSYFNTGSGHRMPRWIDHKFSNPVPVLFQHQGWSRAGLFPTIFVQPKTKAGIYANHHYSSN